MAQVEDGTVPTNTTEPDAAPIAAAEATTEPPAAPAPAPAVAAAAAHEVDVDDGTDSALGEEIQTDTTSLTSTIYRHRHGMTCKYDLGHYHLYSQLIRTFQSSVEHTTLSVAARMTTGVPTTNNRTTN